MCMYTGMVGALCSTKGMSVLSTVGLAVSSHGLISQMTCLAVMPFLVSLLLAMPA